MVKMMGKPSQQRSKPIRELIICRALILQLADQAVDKESRVS